MAARRSGLGRGLDSLIPNNSAVKKTESEKTETKAAEKKAAKKPAAKKAETEKKTPAKTTAAKPAAKKPATEKKTALKSVAKPAAKKPADAKKTAAKATAAKKEAPVKKAEAAAADTKDRILRVRISKVEPDRDQARKNFDKAALKDLADSISQYGVIQPLLVNKKGDHYEIIAGERRWRAANMAGIKEVPVIIADYDDAKRAEVSIIENLQREDLNPIEEANAYARLIDEFDLKQEDVAKKVSKSRTAVTNALRLLRLGEPVQKMVINGELSEGHARCLLSLPDEKAQEDLAGKIVKEKLSVRETERIVKMLLKPVSPRKKAAADDAETLIYNDMADQIRNILGTRVSISRKSKNKGKIEIEYFSQAEFERIVDLLRSIGR